MTTQHWKEQLATHREHQRHNYRRLRDLAVKLVQRSLIRYERERHAYVSRIPFAGRRVSVKERETVTKFIQLQRIIDDQSRLLLELDWTIEQEEKKGNQQQ